MDAPRAIELRDGSDGLIEAWAGGERVAVLVERVSGAGARFTLLARQTPTELVVLVDLVAALLARGAASAREGIELDTTDPLVRDLARHLGFDGTLRGPLAAGRGSLRRDTADPDAAWDALRALLPGIDVRVEAPTGVARSWFRRAASGVPNLVHLYAAPDDVSEPTRFSVPRRDDLMVEAVARCIDTTIAIRRRFGGVAAYAYRIAFDHSAFDSVHGVYAGAAERSIGSIHMNANYASLSGLAAMEAMRAVRASEGWTRPEPRIPVPAHPPAGVPAPYNKIDSTTAHEIWHQMEAVIEGRRSMDGIELRRGLGEALGVETLEQAVNGSRTRTPDTWKAAHGRLVAEVSAYGATAPAEATAEMFALWWCSNGARSPVVERFGELAVPLLEAAGS